MGRSSKEKREQNKTINWAAKFHDQYVMLDAEIYLSVARMLKGRAVLELYDTELHRITLRYPVPEGLVLKLPTDGDLVIARLSDSLPNPTTRDGHDFEASRTIHNKYLRGKIKYWRDRNAER